METVLLQVFEIKFAGFDFLDQVGAVSVGRQLFLQTEPGSFTCKNWIHHQLTLHQALFWFGYQICYNKSISRLAYYVLNLPTISPKPF